MHYLALYNTSTVLRFPLVKRNSVDLAVKADITNTANGDVNFSKDGGAQFNPTNNLNIVTGTTWNITTNANDLACRELVVMVRNNTAVEDQWLTVRTYGNASAYYQWNMESGNVPAQVNAIANNAIGSLAFDQTAGSFPPLGITDQGIAQNTSNNSIKIRSAAPFNSNEIIGGIVVIPSGTGQGQARSILSYNAANNTAAVDNWTTVPNSNTPYKIFAGPPAPTTLPQVQTADFTANALKEFFNTNTTTNYASSVAGSVVKEIADNAGGSSLTVDAIIARLNSNVVVNSVTNSVGSVTGNVGNVTGNIGGSLAGSVGSVTGNVGAVTGNIGGNVAGSVGSVTGSVGSVVANVNTQFIANNGIFAASFNANAITGRSVANDVDIRNVNGNVSVGTVGANVLKEFFNVNSGTNYASAVVGSVVKEIADNAGGSSLTVDAIIARLNSNVVVNTVANSVGSVTGNVGNVTGDIGGNVAGSIGAITANVAKQFFNLNSGTNFASSVAGSVVNEIAANAGAGSAPTVDQMLNRFNSNLALGNQSFTLTGSVTGNVGNVTGNIGGSLAGSVGSVTNNVTVGTIANNAITAVVLNANSITGAKVANDVDIRNVNGNVAGTVGSVTGNVGAVTGNIGGNLAGSVGSVTANVTTGTIANNAITAVVFNANAITGRVVANDVDVRNINGNIAGSVAGSVGSVTNLNALVKAQVVSALTSDTYAEPTQGTPASTLDLGNKINFLYKAWRNKSTQTNNTLSLFAADNATVDQKATVSDNNGLYTRGTIVTGP